MIGFLGNFNQPDLAILAGERPLGADDPTGGGSDGEMDGVVFEQAKLARVALDALNSGDARDRRSSHGSRPRPTINTKTSPCDATNADRMYLSSEAKTPYDQAQKPLHDTYSFSEENTRRRHDSLSDGRPASSQTERLSPRDESDSIATSPALRQYAIPPSEGSPMETLPAMTSPTVALKSPNAQQSLPSLASQLGHLAEGAPPPPTQPLPRPNRQSFSSSGALHSPPKEVNAVRAPPYKSLHTRPNAPYQGVYPATEPSPASTSSAVSPQEYGPGQNPRSMSPPSKFGPRQYQTNGLTPQSDAPTPLSATSTQQSMRTMSSDSSNGGDGMKDPDRPTLPPLTGGTGGPLIGGGFKCEYGGCTAIAFQTQYLLKYVRPFTRWLPTANNPSQFSRQRTLSKSALLPNRIMQSLRR